MNYQIISDNAGVWAVMFYRSPFCNGKLSSDEHGEIEEVLIQNNLVRDRQRLDAITKSTARIRVKSR